MEGRLRRVDKLTPHDLHRLRGEDDLREQLRRDLLDDLLDDLDDEG